MDSQFENVVEFAALSVIALSFIRPSIQIFCAPLGSFYCEQALPSIRSRFAYLLCVLGCLLSGLLILELARHVSRNIFAALGITLIVVFGSAFCVGVLALFSSFFKELLLFRSAKPFLKLALYSALAVLSSLVLIHTQKTPAFYRGVILILFGLPVVIFLSGFYRFRTSRALLDQPAARHVDAISSSPRVVWIVFDELDQRVAFDARPSNLRLPNFDRLFGKSLVCTNACSPSRCTEISLPALLTGRLISETIPYGNGNLALQFAGQTCAEPFQSQQTIFHLISDRSLNSGAIVGYHPLHRVLGEKLVDCLFTAAPTQVNILEAGLAKSVYLCFRSLFETPSYSLFGTSLVSQAAAERYVGVMTRAEEMAGNSELDFAFIHLPIPHAPGIFDASCGRLQARRAKKPTHYLDNLALADISLERLIRAIEGCDRSATAIVTSDHWWRHAAGYDGTIDRRVPVAIHFHAQEEGFNYSERLNTVSLHDLCLAIVDGDVSSPKEAEQWLRKHGSTATPTKL